MQFLRLKINKLLYFAQKEFINCVQRKWQCGQDIPYNKSSSGKDTRRAFSIKEKILKCGRQNERQKQGFLSKKRVFDCRKLSNIQKNRAFMRLFCIITRFWCGRQELKTPIHLKSPLFIRLLSTERQCGRQKNLKLPFSS